MHDIGYVLLTGVLFGVMIGYLGACYALSRADDSDDRAK